MLPVLVKAKQFKVGDHSMLHIKTLDDGLEIFKALGSEIRIEIVKILLENHGMSMNELAGRLNITNGALTNHIKSWRTAASFPYPTNRPDTVTKKNVPSIWTKF